MTIRITPREASKVIRLLGSLQSQLEDEISACLLPGSSQVGDPADRPVVALARRQWKVAEDLVKNLSHEISRERKKARKAPR